MAYSNSPMVSYTKLSPNHSGQRSHSIDRITPHCVVGQCSVETLGGIFAPASRQASSNYGIGADGRVGMYVEEKNRSWCSSNAANDQRAVTIECASDAAEPYAFRDVVYQTLIKLCVDICKRNGKKKLLWLGDKGKTLAYEPKPDEMVLTVHRWFDNKSCPGSWMYTRMSDLAEKVTAQLGGSADSGTPATQLYRVRKAWSDNKSQKGAYKNLDNARKCADANPGYSVFDAAGKNIYTPGTAASFTVKVSIPDLRIRSGPGTDIDSTGKFTGIGVFTIIEVKAGPGSDKGWGRYRKDGDALAIVPEEAAVIRRIYFEFLDGLNYEQISQGLNADGIPTRRGNDVWFNRTVMNVLTNEKYMGDCLFQKTFHIDPLSHKKVPNEGQLPQYYLEDCVPAIVSKEVWNLAQLEIQRRQTWKPMSSAELPFKNRIVCGSCGSGVVQYYAKRKGGTLDTMWRCGCWRKRKAKGEGLPLCAQTKIPLDAPEKAFVRAWNLVVSKKLQYGAALRRRAETAGDALTSYRAKEMLRLLDEMGKLSSFDYYFSLKVLNHMELTPDGKLAVVFLSGIRLTV